MDSRDSNSVDRQQRLDEVVAEYLQAVEDGQSPNQEQWLARYPDLAAELAEFFLAEQRVEEWARPLEATSTGPYLPSTTPHRAGQPARSADDGLSLRPSTAARRRIAPGELLVNRYRVFDIKAGGMGRVYLADDLKALENGVQLKVAIKTVEDFEAWQTTRQAKGSPADATQYTGLLTRFRREAIAWVKLGRHDNIIFAMWVIEDGTKPHLVMEYADSGDLATWIKEGRLSIPLAVNFALQFCEGMQHAVQVSGMVHRDIKPSNVLIKDNRIVKIADFGLSKAFDLQAEQGSAHAAQPSGDAHSSAAAGTRPYMPPEQFESLARADTRSDVFSFGVMLHEMLTGQRLFARQNANEMACFNSPLPLAHEVNSAVPTELSAIVSRCLQYAPAQRFQSFEEVAEHLARVNDALAGGQPIPRDPNTIPEEDFTPSIQALGEAFSLISLGRYEDAAQRAQQGIDIDPLNFEHWVNKGKALVELKDFAAARKCCARATELNPRDARAWTNLGWTDLELGDPAAGLSSAMRAIRLNAEFGDAWMCRGCCHRDLKDPQAALHAHRIATDLEPHNWKAHGNLGFCLAELGMHGPASESLRRSVEINPDNAECWRQLGWLRARGGAWDVGRAAIERALQLEPTHAGAWALRGWIVWAGTADASTAKASVLKSLQLDPANEQAQIVRGVLKQAGVEMT